MVLLPRRGSSGLVASASSTLAPCPPHRRPYAPNPALKGIFAGSGSAAMSNKHMARAVVELTRRDARDVNLLYIGTASYDIAKFRDRQTGMFSKMGCSVSSLDVANRSVPREAMEKAVDEADILLVSGGNTLYAVDRWVYLGLDELLRAAAQNGKVLAGGSAGAICWFDGGHSDSGDPDTYRSSMLEQFEGGPSDSNSNTDNEGTRGLSEGSTDSDDGASDWEYIRVEGLGIWPGLVCPHYDRIQSNGVPRMTDFDAMMKRHRYELGIGIDHHAALEVDGDVFRVLSIPNEEGSVPDAEDGSKVPGAWLKYVDDDGDLHSICCPKNGKVSELLQMVETPNKHLALDEKVEACRKENPLLRD
ncbi:hypothetical protein ACHAXT_003819 [Thalassiosira profunda]